MRPPIRVRGAITATIQLTPESAKIIDTNSGYIWIGTERHCFGYIEDLRTIRTLHAHLGALIVKRERTATKKRARKTAPR